MQHEQHDLICGWIKDGKIKSVRVNGLVRIPEEEIQRLKKGE